MRQNRVRPRSRHDPVSVALGLGAVVAFVLTAGAAAQAGVSQHGWLVPAGTVVPAAEPGPDPGPAPPVAPAPAGPVVPARASAAWVASTSAATGIGPVAMRAYANATLALAAEQPACRVGWTTLASIGATESGHGTHGGAVLDDDGRPSLPIIGPALDGRPGFAAIPADPDATAWHGDPVWDHAVGPLQFLPSTWRRWGADGDGDQVADPNDLDDAALAAGRYLCAAGTDLTAAPAWQAAVLSYNHSQEYVAAILASANGYAAASQVSGGGA